MQYNFTINNDKIVCNKNSTPYTGNINTYRCVFDITAKIDNLSWFCVFEREDKAYVQPILNNECFIPHEVLTSEGTIKIGCYATNLNENDYKRISTNWVYFKSLEGAYSDASTPDVPEPDVWEELVLKSVPIIGENGNWYIYDISQEKYVDSGVKAEGDTPIKGVHYWTEEDKAEIIENMSDEGYITNTDYATKDVAGVVKVNKDSGIKFADNKTLMIVAADEDAIDKGTSSLRPITPNVLKYAVKSVTYDKAEIANTYATKTELNTFSNNTTEEFQRVREEIDAEHVNTYYTYATKEELADSKKWKTLIDVTLTEEQAGVSEILLAIEDVEAFIDARQIRITVSFPVAEEKAANSFWTTFRICDNDQTKYSATVLAGHNAKGNANSTYFADCLMNMSEFKYSNPQQKTFLALSMLPTPWYMASANTVKTGSVASGGLVASHMRIYPPYLNIAFSGGSMPTFEAGAHIFMEVCE